MQLFGKKRELWMRKPMTRVHADGIAHPDCTLCQSAHGQPATPPCILSDIPSIYLPRC
jgi:hypothetical protein